MGSGKTTVGKVAADRLGIEFADTDQVVESRAGITVQEMFAKSGEEAFREAESGALAELLERREPLIVAAGGGAVLADANRRLMGDQARVVWLRTTVATLAERVGSGEGRPLLSGDATEEDAIARLARIESERAAIYASLADFVVDTDGRSAESVAEEVIAAVAAASTATRTTAK